MKSRISFFNPTVFRKDITRFAPLWALYLVGALLITLGAFGQADPVYLVNFLGDGLGLFSIINFIYALLCGQLLFGDLFNARLCNALHAMPLRREGWFLTHVISGLAFSVVPNLIVALSLLPQLSGYWYTAFIWVGVMTLSYLFFFGAAVLSAFCTGSRFAMALVYGIVNFLSIIALWVVALLYEPLLYGITIQPDAFIFLSPVCYLVSHELQFPYLTPLTNALNGWPYLIGIALTGAVMLVTALLLYRRRNLESAGDFIAVRPLAPVFCVLYTITAGMVFFLFTYIFGLDDGFLFLAVGIAAGYITGQMLIRRTVKVFKPSTFIGLAMVAAVLFGSLWLTKLDLTGIVSWTPESEDVASVKVYGYNNHRTYTAADAGEIADLVDIHQQILDGRDKHSPNTVPIHLDYTLKNGAAVSRNYEIVIESDIGEDLLPYFSKPEYVLATDDVEKFLDRVVFAEFYTDESKGFTDTELQSLMDAIIADCEAGSMVQDWYYGERTHIGWLDIHLREKVNDNSTRSITIWDTCENTLAWMKAHEVAY